MFHQTIRNCNASIVGISFLLLLMIALPASGQEQKTNQKQALSPNQKLERSLQGGETHSYSITLKSGQYFHVDVEQHGIDVVLLLVAPDGKTLVERDRPNGTNGQESLSFIPLTGGDYRLDVKAPDAKAGAGRYEIRSELLRAPSAQDKKRIEAENLFQEGQQLGEKGTAESAKQADEKYEAAAVLWHDIADKYAEALTQTSLANAREKLGEREKAITAHAKALTLFRELNDKHNEARKLSDLGDISHDNGEKQKALDYYKQALPLFRELGDKRNEASILSNIGYMYKALDDNQKALDYYNQALALRKSIGDKGGSAVTLNNIGAMYDDLGEKRKALDYYNQAAPLFKEAGDKSSAAFALNNIGYVYQALGEKQKALDYFGQALPLFKEVGDKSGEAFILTNTGALYASLGEKQKALGYYDRALPLFKEIRDKRGEAAILTNIGGVYNDSGEKQKALDYYKQALPLFKAFGSRRNEATMLTNIGAAYNHLGEKQKALDYYTQALLISRAIGDRGGEATTLHNLGRLYNLIGERQKALDYYSQALPLYRAVGNRTGEAVMINNLMVVYFWLGNPRLAISYGKQSANAYQQLRSNIQTLDKGIQRSYLKTVENTYRSLADLLISQSRSAEALQVLNAFKDQQYFDLNPEVLKKPLPLAMTQREVEFSAQYDIAGNRIEDASRRFEEFKLTVGKRQPNAQEAIQLQKLQSELKAAAEGFLATLKQAETDFSQPADTVEDKSPNIDGAGEMQAALRKLGQKTCVIYTLAGEDNFYALIVTSDDMIAVSSPIRREMVNTKAKQLWALLQSDEYDPKLLSKEMYDLLFKPIKDKLVLENKLDKVLPEGATIMWSLDDNLRYLPIAALFDGEKYLVERYNNVVFTRADTERWTRPVSRRWTGIGFGSSRGGNIEFLNIVYPFDDLPNVTEELNAVFRTNNSNSGVFEGEIFPDLKFTRETMIAALKQRRPLVHISSHFRFAPGDEVRSFLLLGDGTIFPLSEMKQHADLFQGVELLTLSACETAAQGVNSDGREVDGFAELAQRLGASAVLATLWNVRDDSSYWLVREFYRGKRELSKQTKVESLRQAQVALLNGAAKVKPLTRAGSINAKRGSSNSTAIKILPEGKKPSPNTEDGVVYVEAKYAKLHKRNNSKPYAHPYFWSPFVLFGNWQ